MAMIETTHFDPIERDATKDSRTDGGANASIFNLSEDLLRHVGYVGNIHLLDPLARLPDVVACIDKGIDMWGVQRRCDTSKRIFAVEARIMTSTAH